MATSAPVTHCWVCGKQEEYRVVTQHHDEVLYGPTEWQRVPHAHTQIEIEAWLNRAIARDRK